MFGPLYRVKFSNKKDQQTPPYVKPGAESKYLQSNHNRETKLNKLGFWIAVVLKIDKMLSWDIPIVIPVRYGRPSIMLTSMGQKYS